MDSASVLVQEGIRLAAMGGHEQAQALFAKAVEIDPHNEAAWLWLAELAEQDEDRIGCLEEVVKINPANRGAAEQLRSLTGQMVRSVRQEELDPSEIIPVTASEEPGSQQEPVQEQCPTCGEYNPASYAFCGHCGASLAEASQEPVQPEVGEPTEAEPSEEPAPAVLEDDVQPADTAGVVASRDQGRGGRDKWFLVGGAGVVLSLLVLWLLAGTATPAAVLSPQDPNEASFRCVRDLARDGMELWDDMDRVLSAAMHDDWMGGLCEAENLWRSRVDGLKSRLPCPTSSDADLAAANEYVWTAVMMDLDGVLYSAEKQCEFPDQYWDEGVIDSMVEGYDMLEAALVHLERYNDRR